MKKRTVAACLVGFVFLSSGSGCYEDKDPLMVMAGGAAITCGVVAVGLVATHRERVEENERKRRSIERERRVYPRRFRRMRKKKYLGWGLVVGGALLASLGEPEEGPDPSVEPERTGWDMAAQVSGYSVVAVGGVLLLQSYGYEANVQLSIAPNGCMLTCRF